MLCMNKHVRICVRLVPHDLEFKTSCHLQNQLTPIIITTNSSHQPVFVHVHVCSRLTGICATLCGWIKNTATHFISYKDAASRHFIKCKTTKKHFTVPKRLMYTLLLQWRIIVETYEQAVVMHNHILTSTCRTMCGR